MDRGKEHNKYGRKSVVWPDGKKTVERVHRLSYMLTYRTLKDDVPRHDENGQQLDVSHI